MADSKLTIATKKGWLIQAMDNNLVQMLEAVENELAIRDARIDALEVQVAELLKGS